jgi:hypothetical protein
MDVSLVAIAASGFSHIQADRTDYPVDRILDFCEEDDEKLREICEKHWDSAYGIIAQDDGDGKRKGLSRTDVQNSFKRAMIRAYERHFRALQWSSKMAEKAKGNLSASEFDIAMREYDTQMPEFFGKYNWVCFALACTTDEKMRPILNRTLFSASFHCLQMPLQRRQLPNMRSTVPF